MQTTFELTILMPCLNEALTLPTCIAAAKAYLSRSGVEGEVLVADNGSTDGSQSLAESLGARVVHVKERGYGSALRAGIRCARGRFVIMADSDASYDFSRLDQFMERLRSGDQLVMGNRFKGGIKAGAMPLLHRYLGNPVLSFLGRTFFNVPVKDFHCGLRGFDREAIQKLSLTTDGMEFASEMVVKAALAKLKISEVPTTLEPDGRDRPPHLRSWRDGWRHLRFLLLLSPRWLFLYPGMIFMSAGLLGMALILPGSFRVADVVFDIHTLLYCAGLSIMGAQLVMLGALARIVGVRLGLLPENGFSKWAMKRFRLELALIMGGVLLLASVASVASSWLSWADVHFSALEPRLVMRQAIPAVALALLAIEFIGFSFFLTFLQFDHERKKHADELGA